MRILEICEFSSGIGGVWQRVKQEAELLAEKGYEVHIFSSDIIEGTKEIAPSEEFIGKLKIKRLPNKRNNLSGSITKNVTYFDFKKSFFDLKPDVVITHTIHPHSFKVLEYSKKLNIPCYLVTHAPFDVKRNLILSALTKIYYSFKVKSKINKFTKIITITKWELPYLEKLGIKEDKIDYIPNGIPDEFFKQKIKKFQGKNIIFLGRIAPVKDLETLIKAFNIIQGKKPQLKLKIIGPEEEPYSTEIKNLVKNLNLQNSIEFIAPIYDLNKKIQTLQKSDIFVLSSKREAMPQALIEAMSLGKIVISTKTQGGLEIIEEGKTGFLFDIGDENGLANIIEFCLNKSNHKLTHEVQKLARKKAEEFKWSILIKKLNSLINKK